MVLPKVECPLGKAGLVVRLPQDSLELGDCWICTAKAGASAVVQGVPLIWDATWKGRGSPFR
jgi:hypothetical protein